jgi:hypothetical protein
VWYITPIDKYKKGEIKNSTIGATLDLMAYGTGAMNISTIATKNKYPNNERWIKCHRLGSQLTFVCFKTILPNMYIIAIANHLSKCLSNLGSEEILKRELKSINLMAE